MTIHDRRRGKGQAIRLPARTQPFCQEVFPGPPTHSPSSDKFSGTNPITRHLGWFHFRPGDGHADDEPELGYRLRRSAWGKGYATEGCRALIDKGFAEHGVRRVLAETMVVHTASRRVMEKSGLRLVRVFHADWPDRIPGDEYGDVEYALDREEWQRRAPRRTATNPSTTARFCRCPPGRDWIASPRVWGAYALGK